MLVRNQILILFLLFAGGLSAQMSEAQVDYIDRFNEIAIREMERSGVPASIKLAQGLLESNAGRSDLARRANNHFGIKCGSTWEGDTMYKEDDDYDENGRLVKSCFRSYRNADASFVAHSEFLRDPRKAFRYGFLFRLDPYDYKAWAYGLKRAGYATSPTYPEKLITLIERYQLYKYDKQTLLAVEDPGDVIPGSGTDGGTGIDLGTGILRTNDVNYVLASEGETLDDIARRVEVSVSNLLSYNEQLRKSSSLQTGERVYVQPKRNAYRGRQKYHVVEAGQTLMEISNEYAVKLSKLLDRNRLESGQQPAVGEKIKLRGWCKVKEAPRLRSEVETGTTTPTAPNAPEGELEMEEPDDEFLEEEIPSGSTRPGAGTQPGNTQPTTPPVSTQPEQPGVIITPGSRPVTPPSTTETDPLPPYTPPTTQPANPPSTQPANPAPAPTTDAVYHNVQAGETLWAISQRYNTTVEAIKQLNGLANNNISIGQQLRVK